MGEREIGFLLASLIPCEAHWWNWRTEHMTVESVDQRKKKED